MEHQANTHETGTTMNNLLSAIFLLVGGIAHYVQDITYADIYNFVFRALSLISLVFVIVINWPKVKEVLRKKPTRK